jgi:hypothetical protein
MSKTVRASAITGVALIGLLAVSSASAAGATVTRGEFHAFASGTGLDISGRAQVVRTADGKTIVSVHLAGLAVDTTYGSHIHQKACNDSDADGHYKFDPSGPASPPNEIWPGFTTNGAGIGNGKATVHQTAGPEAVSVVVHAPGGAKIACADLR